MVVLWDSTFGVVYFLKSKNMETNDNSEKKGSVAHFMLLFVGFIVLLITISYLVVSLMK